MTTKSTLLIIENVSLVLLLLASTKGLRFDLGLFPQFFAFPLSSSLSSPPPPLSFQIYHFHPPNPPFPSRVAEIETSREKKYSGALPSQRVHCLFRFLSRCTGVSQPATQPGVVRLLESRIRRWSFTLLPLVLPSLQANAARIFTFPYLSALPRVSFLTRWMDSIGTRTFRIIIFWSSWLWYDYVLIVIVIVIHLLINILAWTIINRAFAIMDADDSMLLNFDNRNLFFFLIYLFRNTHSE